jgi:hypothetical protein
MQNISQEEWLSRELLTFHIDHNKEDNSFCLELQGSQVSPGGSWGRDQDPHLTDEGVEAPGAQGTWTERGKTRYEQRGPKSHLSHLSEVMD